MHQLVNRFDPNIPIEERMRLALAAYNVGYGHVLDARRLAREKGWNPDRWFGHVEQAMRLLAKPVYYQRARYGFCRCGQPVHYVGNIQNYYDAYVGMLTMARGSGPRAPLSSNASGKLSRAVRWFTAGRDRVSVFFVLSV